MYETTFTGVLFIICKPRARLAASIKPVNLATRIRSTELVGQALVKNQKEYWFVQ